MWPAKKRKMQNNNNTNNRVPYENVTARDFEASAAMQQAQGAAMGGYGHLPHRAMQERLFPTMQPVPMRKLPGAHYLAPGPPLPQRYLPPTSHSVLQMNEEAVASRKRPHAVTMPESTEASDSKKRAYASADGESEEVIDNIPEGAPEKNPAKVPPGTVGISSHAEDDVLSGRGGGTNSHPGNRYFRELINTHRYEYLRAKKNDKPHISRSIVNVIRAKKGRFLKKDEDDGLWYEIGDDLAREKTSQALRQKAPEHRKIVEEHDRRLQQQRTIMNAPQSFPMGVAMMDRRAAHMVIPPPPPLPTHSEQLHLHNPYEDNIMRHYIDLKQRHAELQREIELVKEIKEIKEQMAVYHQQQQHYR